MTSTKLARYRVDSKLRRPPESAQIRPTSSVIYNEKIRAWRTVRLRVISELV